MIFFATTPAGLAEALKLAAGIAPVWCTSNAISEQEFSTMQGRNLTRFLYTLDGDFQDQLAGALDSIAEHHPGERIWVEYNVGA